MGVYLTPKNCPHCNFLFERPSQAVKGCPSCGRTSGDPVVGLSQLKPIQTTLEKHGDDIERLTNRLENLDQKYEKKLNEAVKFVIDNFQLKEQEKNILLETMDKVQEIEEWTNRIKYWADKLKHLPIVLKTVLKILGIDLD